MQRPQVEHQGPVHLHEAQGHQHGQDLGANHRSGRQDNHLRRSTRERSGQVASEEEAVRARAVRVRRHSGPESEAVDRRGEHLAESAFHVAAGRQHQGPHDCRFVQSGRLSNTQSQGHEEKPERKRVSFE